MNKKAKALQRMQVFYLLGKRPVTASQLEQRAIKRGVPVDRYAISRRLPELRERGVVEDCGNVECPIRRVSMKAWRLV